MDDWRLSRPSLGSWVRLMNHMALGVGEVVSIVTRWTDIDRARTIVPCPCGHVCIRSGQSKRDRLSAQLLHRSPEPGSIVRIYLLGTALVNLIAHPRLPLAPAVRVAIAVVPKSVQAANASLIPARLTPYPLSTNGSPCSPSPPVTPHPAYKPGPFAGLSITGAPVSKTKPSSIFPSQRILQTSHGLLVRNLHHALAVHLSGAAGVLTDYGGLVVHLPWIAHAWDVHEARDGRMEAGRVRVKDECVHWEVISRGRKHCGTWAGGRTRDEGEELREREVVVGAHLGSGRVRELQIHQWHRRILSQGMGKLLCW